MRKLIILSFVMLIISLSLVSPIKEEYFIGEAVKIDLEGIGTYLAKITTPSSSFIQKSNNSFFIFEVYEAGPHTIEIESSSLDETYTFLATESLTAEDQNTKTTETIYLGTNNLSVEEVETAEPLRYTDATRILTNRITVGKEVTWNKQTFIPETKNIAITIPQAAENILLNNKSTGFEIKQTTLNSVKNIFKKEKTTSLAIHNIQGNIDITYTTPAPQKEEEILSKTQKRVTIFTKEELGYTNVLAFSQIEEIVPVGKEGLITIEWLNEEKKIGFEAFDTNENGLIDYLEWNVPHLSEQEFEINITIINPQSYPVVGGNWTVAFETLGTADLQITATNGTTWSDTSSEGELKFLALQCGETTVPYTWNDGVYVENFSCDETAYEISEVLSQGAHYLQFDFGGITALAQNDATDPYDNLTQLYITTFGQALPLTTDVVLNISTETLVDEGYTHTTSEPTRIYVNSIDNYKITYACTLDNSGVGNRAIFENYIRRNGNEEITPSRTSCYTRNSNTDGDRCSNQGTLIASLTDGDYLELMGYQLKQESTGDGVTAQDCWMYVQRVRRPVAQIYDAIGGDLYDLGTDITVNLDTETYTDSRAFIANTGSDNIEIDADSWYKVYYHTCADNGPTTARANGVAYLQNTGTEITPSRVYGHYRNNNGGDTNCEQGFLLYNFTDGNTITLRKGKEVAASATQDSTTLANQSWLTIEQVPFTDIYMGYVNASTQTLTSGTPEAINITTDYVSGTSYSHAGSNSRITIETDGLYEVSYVVSWDDGAPGGTDRVVVCADLRLNGSYVQPSRNCDYTRGRTDMRYGTVSGTVIVNISSGEYLELFAGPTGRDVSVYADSTWINIIPLNTFIDGVGPTPLGTEANKSNPVPGELVNFSANWTDASGLKSWDFFWNLGSGFEPGGSGTFTGENGTSAIVKTIPASMEGQTLYYYFRASDTEDFANQTNGTHFVSVQDVTPPAVNTQSLNATAINYSQILLISTNVTDNTAVSDVWATIGRPDGLYENISLQNITLDDYEATYQSNLIGAYNVSIYANDTNSLQGNGTPLYWNTSGFANIAMTNPLGGSYPAESSIALSCEVRDANTSTAIGGYQVTFYSEETLLGTNTTNSTGVAIFNWVAEGPLTTTLNCTITDDTNLHYYAQEAMDSTDITLLFPAIEVVDVEYENGVTSGLYEYETTDVLDWVNITVNNTGNTTANNVNTTLTLLYPNGTRAEWFSETHEFCGTLTVGQTCEPQFDNSGTGFTLTGEQGGLYTFNATTNWTGGGTIPDINLSALQIHYVPGNITGALSDSEVSAGTNSTYDVTIMNPWSENITGVNVTINCPTVLGLDCFWNQSGTQTRTLGTIESLQTTPFFFNVTTNDSTPIGTYNITIDVEYINPTNSEKTWNEIELDQFIVRPLLAEIYESPSTITRTNNADLKGYAKNIGLGILTNVNYTWILPFGWSNTTGVLENETSTLSPDEFFWSNISILVNESSAIGPHTIDFIADSPDAAQDTASATITIYADTAIPQIEVNDTTPFRNSEVLITARLVYDNGTAIPNQKLLFQQGAVNGTTNATGHATVTYTIPSDAATGPDNFFINVSFEGNTSEYLNPSLNATTISVQDFLLIEESHSPTTAGYGGNITINANVTTSGSVSHVFANITTPSSQQYFTEMIFDSGDLYAINFSETWESGTHNYSVWANNTIGFENETLVKGTFTIEGNVTFFVDTIEAFYTPNQFVNLTKGELTQTSFTPYAEQGLMIVSGVTDNTTTLSRTYQLNKTFILTESAIRSSSSQNPDQRMGRVYFSSITNGMSNELTARRNSATNTMVASYNVLEADNIDVCHVNNTMADSDGNNDVDLSLCDTPLPSNYEQKCFVAARHNVEAGSSTNSCSEEHRVMANITNTTNLNLQRSSVSCGAAVVEAQVVCFNDDTTVTPVEIGPSQFSTGVTAGIGHTINTSNSWMTYSCQSDGNGIEHANIECYISSSSQITCRTSTLGTSETSSQHCIAYVIEFDAGRRGYTQNYVPTDAEVGDNTQFTSVLPENVTLSDTIGYCASSFRSGEGNAYPRGDYACYLSDEGTFTCERGQTGNTDPSHDFHCQTIRWPTLHDTPNTISTLENLGTTDIFAYFLMTVEYNNSGVWEYVDTVLNDTATAIQRELLNLDTYNLTDYWNDEAGGWDTASNQGGYYRAAVSLTDNTGTTLVADGGNITSYSDQFYIDGDAPEITLTYPDNDSTTFGLTAIVNYSATDISGVDSCSLFHNKSGLFTLEETKTHTADINNTFTIEGFTENTYIRWNVRCNDSVGNQGFSSEDFYFLQIVPPDFLVNTSSITMQNESAIEGANSTINATVWNEGGQDGTALVSFYLGDPDTGGTSIGNHTLFVATGTYNVSSIEWPAEIGPANIFVHVDPPLATNGSITEINETNNEVNNTFTIRSWQELYGNATIQVLLANESLVEIDNWGSPTNPQGNIFVTDQESVIDWNSLLALGKTTGGANSSNDFLELDSIIGTTNFTDSVSTIFSNSQIPKQFQSFDVYGTTIEFVPYINSTENSSFVTGILWDGSDNSNTEYDSTEREDIVFVAKMNPNKPGTYGTYDYEVSIPVRLRSYETTQETQVYLYYDLN